MAHSKSISQLPIETLPGGQRLLLVKNKSYLTNVQILTSVGSSAEDPDIHGMAHILEHMFFKGSRKYRGGTAISRAANDIGGKMNAYTTYDHTAFYITVLNEEFEKGFDILGDMYNYPEFPPDEFKKELNPILSEMREREDDPESFIMEKALENYLGANYHSVIGTQSTVKSATAEKMHNFKSRYYAGDNSLICIVGGIDEALARDTALKYFSQGTTGTRPNSKPYDYKKGEIVLKKPGIQEANFNLFFPALAPNNPERYKQDLMCYLLGGNDSALLFERIREELGMSCYGIYAYNMRTEGHSVLGISCGIAPNEIEQLEEEVDKCIARICTSILEPDRLDRARASLRTSIASHAETSSGLGGMLALPALRGETDHPVDKALAEIEKITLEEVLEMAKQTFQGPRFKAILLPE